MIITDRFIYIHQPKTGGTFVTDVLRRIHVRPRLGPLFADRNGALFQKSLWGYRDANKHGTCDDIPPPHRAKPILATIRSPYDRYVSQFEFGWWKKYPEEFGDPQAMRRRFPGFPELSFSEFIDMSNTVFLPFGDKPDLPEGRSGLQTWHFVRHFFRNGEQVFPRIDSDYISTSAREKDMYPVHFINTDRLNQELHDFLLSVGYRPADVEFILTESKILPPGSSRDDRPWQSYYTPELKQLVRQRERLLFEIFPRFDV